MKYFVTAFILTGFAASASAQLTLTESDFLSLWTKTMAQTDYTATSANGAGVLVNSTASGQTWDFTHFAYGSGQSSTNSTLLPYPSGAPFASDPDFSTATHVIRDTSTDGVIVYEFVKITPDGGWILGASQDSLGHTSKVLTYSPAWQFIKFPMTLGTSWTSTSSLTVPGMPPGFQYSWTTNYVADAEGTLITPPSHSNPALRLKEQIITTIAYPPFYSAKDTSNSYNWYTKAGYSASVGLDSMMRPNSVSYSDPVGGNGGGTPSPGVAWQSGTTGSFGSGTIGTTQTQNFVLVDTSSLPVVIDHISFSGTNNSEFTLGALPFPATISAGNGTLTIPVTWKPTGTAGTRTATMTITPSTEGLPPITLTLSGTATAASGGVTESNASSFDVQVWPNPVSSSSTITFTGANNASVQWVILDPLGRVQYSSTGNLGTTNQISPESLGLANGVYYLKATVAGESTTREIVIAR